MVPTHGSSAGGNPILETTDGHKMNMAINQVGQTNASFLFHNTVCSSI